MVEVSHKSSLDWSYIDRPDDEPQFAAGVSGFRGPAYLDPKFTRDQLALVGEIVLLWNSAQNSLASTCRWLQRGEAGLIPFSPEMAGEDNIAEWSALEKDLSRADFAFLFDFIEKNSIFHRVESDNLSALLAEKDYIINVKLERDAICHGNILPYIIYNSPMFGKANPQKPTAPLAVRRGDIGVTVADLPRVHRRACYAAMVCSLIFIEAGPSRNEFDTSLPGRRPDA